MQQRARLGVIDGAEENVDLGALLSRLASMFARTKNTGVVSLVGAAQAAYQAAIPHFQRDGELPDVRLGPGGGWRWCAQGSGPGGPGCDRSEFARSTCPTGALRQ